MFWQKFPLTGYVDMHIHIVPNVDDGAVDLETAITMAKMAYEDGTRAMIVTPHHHPNKEHCDHETMYELFLEFQRNLVKEVPGLTLHYGREIFCNNDAVEELIKNSKQREAISLICMSNSKYVLLEFDVGVDYSNMLRQIQTIQLHGYWPVIAHVERYGCITSHPERLEDLKQMSLIIQVNASTVTGSMGRGMQKFVLDAMQDGLVDLVASDAHSARTRHPRLKEAAKVIARKCGADVAEQLLIHNPRCIIEGKYLEEQ